MLSEKLRLNSRLTCRSSVSLSELAQLLVGNCKFSNATIQTDNKLWKYPHYGLVNIFQFQKMDTHLRSELPLVG
jgi:hypothetical protein